MAHEAPRHPLRDLFADRDEDTPVDWLTGLVVSHQQTARPWTVVARLADGAETGPITYPGWWAPAVGDTVQLIRKGPRVAVFSVDAPANLAVAGAFVAPPPLPAPPAPPPTTRTVTVQPTGLAYWTRWGWRYDPPMSQGNPDGRVLWVYGDQIEAARAGGTIIAASVYVKRDASVHGDPGLANVRLGVHPHRVIPPGNPGALAEVNPTAARLLRGRDTIVHLTDAQVAELNTEQGGVGLEPGDPSPASPDHLRAAAVGASGALSLTVTA